MHVAALCFLLAQGVAEEDGLTIIRGGVQEVPFERLPDPDRTIPLAIVLAPDEPGSVAYSVVLVGPDGGVLRNDRFLDEVAEHGPGMVPLLKTARVMPLKGVSTPGWHDLILFVEGVEVTRLRFLATLEPDPGSPA